MADTYPVYHALIERGMALGSKPQEFPYMNWKMNVYAVVRVVSELETTHDSIKDIDDAFWRGERMPFDTPVPPPPPPNLAKGRDEVCDLLTSWCS